MLSNLTNSNFKTILLKIQSFNQDSKLSTTSELLRVALDETIDFEVYLPHVLNSKTKLINDSSEYTVKKVNQGSVKRRRPYLWM
jgi:hypothetical protein